VKAITKLRRSFLIVVFLVLLASAYWWFTSGLVVDSPGTLAVLFITKQFRQKNGRWPASAKELDPLIDQRARQDVQYFELTYSFTTTSDGSCIVHFRAGGNETFDKKLKP
jgi:hypothetical protein